MKEGRGKTHRKEEGKNREREDTKKGRGDGKTRGNYGWEGRGVVKTK